MSWKKSERIILGGCQCQIALAAFLIKQDVNKREIERGTKQQEKAKSNGRKKEK